MQPTIAGLLERSIRPEKRLLWVAYLAGAVLLVGSSAVFARDESGDGSGQAGQQSPPADPERRDRVGQESRGGKRSAGPKRIRTGLLRHEQGASEGYTLFVPIRSTTTYLIDMDGNVVHSWESDSPPGHAAYLLENGNLLRCARERENETFRGGGVGGRVQEIAWDGTVVWDFIYSNDQHCQHHDIEPLPNGNVLLIAWERKSAADAIAAGRNPELLPSEELRPDHVVEVRPDRPRGGTIVWEWHVWDHLIQDHDPDKANFGVVADYPELIDVNFGGDSGPLSPEERRRLEALGYMPPLPEPRAGRGIPDWNHINAIAYNAELDQIALTVLGFSEVWVIDHSTTTAQAAGHTGGRSGRGGDILYRWGNPRAYRAGSVGDQQLFAQHDAHWIASGLRGAGNLLVFNNGHRRPGGEYSSVEEIVPPLDEAGRYVREPGAAFGPALPLWTYTAPRKTSFLSRRISGAQRLANGNTLVCSGEHGRFFELDTDGRVVWEYVNPFGRRPPEPRPPAPPGGRARGGHPLRDRPPRTGAGPNPVFRAIRLPPDHPGLVGKDLAASEAKPAKPLVP
ncbi:MAG: aryl-sulfate sulfotransferase [Planctomycetes bacterium]|nr:aryl-sulfate sulfotransferase [Planctomycetota bacterium]